MTFTQNPELFTVIFIVTIESFLIITHNIKFAYDKTIKVIFKNNDAANIFFFGNFIMLVFITMLWTRWLSR